MVIGITVIRLVALIYFNCVGNKVILFMALISISLSIACTIFILLFFVSSSASGHQYLLLMSESVGSGRSGEVLGIS